MFWKHILHFFVAFVNLFNETNVWQHSRRRETPKFMDKVLQRLETSCARMHATCQQYFCFSADERALKEMNNWPLLCQQHEMMANQRLYEAWNVTPSRERKVGSKRGMERGGDGRHNGRKEAHVWVLFWGGGLSLHFFKFKPEFWS